LIKKLKKLFANLRWIKESQKFKKNRFKTGRGDDFHHE
jgi:hypothetical protein